MVPHLLHSSKGNDLLPYRSTLARVICFFLLQLQYGSTKIDPAMTMTPTNVKDKPTVSFSADPSAYYTLIMNGTFSFCPVKSLLLLLFLLFQQICNQFESSQVSITA